LSQKLIYGDFAADSSKFIFASGGTAPIPHYRYSTTTHWVVVRASDGAGVSDAMKEAAIRLVGSKHFAGPSFSSGDRYIAETADGRDGPGNGTIWRRVNTIHHLTRVITDLGPYHGYRIVERIGGTGEQADLFRSFR
jgi:hypothetical protein